MWRLVWVCWNVESGLVRSMCCSTRSLIWRSRNGGALGRVVDWHSCARVSHIDNAHGKAVAMWFREGKPRWIGIASSSWPMAEQPPESEKHVPDPDARLERMCWRCTIRAHCQGQQLVAGEPSWGPTVAGLGSGSVRTPKLVKCGVWAPSLIHQWVFETKYGQPHFLSRNLQRPPPEPRSKSMAK